MQFSGRPFAAATAASVPTKPCPSSVPKVSKSESLKVLLTKLPFLCTMQLIYVFVQQVQQCNAVQTESNAH